MPDLHHDYKSLDTYFRHIHRVETVLMSLHAGHIALLKLAAETSEGKEAVWAMSDILGSFIEEMESFKNQQ